MNSSPRLRSEPGKNVAGVGDRASPTVVSATIPSAGTTVSVVYSEPVFVVPGATGYSLNDGVLNHTLTVSSGNGSITVVFAIGHAISSGETCLLSKAVAATGVTLDSFGNPIAAFTDAAVTNNSTQP